MVGGGRFGQLDQVAGRILEEDLLDLDAGDDVVARAGPSVAQLLDAGVEVGDLQGEAVPPAGFLLGPIRHGGATATAAGDAEQHPKVAPVQHGEHR